MSRYDITHYEMDNPAYGAAGEATLDSARVNLAKYKGASRAARAYADKKGISKVKATKALSETTRALVDTEYGMGAQGQRNISRSLTGLTKRLAEGNRGGRFAGSSGYYNTLKGQAIGTFGQHLGAQLGMGKTYVMRPKPPKNTLVKGAKAAASIIGKLK